MGSNLQLMLLGKPRFTMGGIPLAGLTRRKSTALLAYLAVTARAHDRGALAGLLWGEATEANARASLRKVLAELRRQVPAHLIISRTEVAFDRGSPYWLDVEVSEARISRALTLRSGLLTSEGAAALEEAVELVRGDFMEGVEVRGAPDFEVWLLLEREHLRNVSLRALEALVDYHAARGGYARAISHADRLLALEPAHERAHRIKMLLLALSGQRPAALRQYQTCCQALAALDAKPEGETVALHRRIRAWARLPNPAREPPHNLPAPLTPLVGREAELAEIGARLHDPACRLLTLVGPGGSGKTHLALEAAAAVITAATPWADTWSGDVPSAAGISARVASAPQRGRFDDGIFFVPLASVPGAQALAPTLAHALDVPLSGPVSAWRDPEGRVSIREQLLDFVRTKRLVLVLDGFEHLLAGVKLVVDLLKTAPAVKILVTSRARLDVEGEHLLRIWELTCPERLPGDRETLAASPAVQLFLTCARRIRPRFEMADADLAEVARICHLVGGLPLGILLSSAWVGILSPGEIAARLSGRGGQSLDLLETDRRDLPARQRSMRAVFDHSWALLTEREQQVLGALSALPGSFDQEAAERVAGASLRDLRSLVDKSMLHRASPGRYQLHGLLRQYAREKAEAVPGAAQAAC